MASGSAAKTGFLAKSWRFIKWPGMIAFLVLSGSFALTSALGVLGFNGTTNLRMISSAEWKKFNDQYFDSGAGKIGKPYEMVGSKQTPRPTGDGMVYFDKRLVEMLTYLADGPKTNGSCQGWYPSALGDPGTDKIKLSITSNVDSNLYAPPDNLPSVSTIYRGVGVRFEGMDKIKCTAFYPNPALEDPCSKPIPKSFGEFNILFDETKKFLDPQPTKPLPTGTCPNKPTICAVNRYPDDPIDISDANEEKAESYNPAELSTPWGNLTRELTGFLYNPATMAQNEGRQAAIYKMAQLAYQIMSIDDEGCLSADGLKGYKKITPYQVIFPEWVKKELENKKVVGSKESVWSDIQKMGRDLKNGGKYLIDLQKNSSLAGIIWDPENYDFFGSPTAGRTSNLEVLHVNY